MGQRCQTGDFADAVERQVKFFQRLASFEIFYNFNFVQRQIEILQILQAAYVFYKIDSENRLLKGDFKGEIHLFVC